MRKVLNKRRDRFFCISLVILTSTILVTYVLIWDLLVGGPASPIWALAYGVATTIASWFFVFPSMGLGVFGRRSPEGIRAPLSSLGNHLFYGVGIAVGIALV